MKRLTTILCAVAFLIGGIAITHTKNDVPKVEFTTNSAHAQVLPFRFTNEQYCTTPTVVERVDTLVVPTSVTVQVSSKKSLRAKAPKVIEKHDTTFVPVFYIITPSGDSINPELNFPIEQEIDSIR